MGILSKIGMAKGQRNGASEVKSFREHQRKEGAFDSRVRGLRKVPLRQIVGSVGRYHDFDSKFRLKNHLPQERIELIKKALRNGKHIRAVDLYQIKDEYYVLDGNHRISVAKEFGFEEVNANVIEFIPSSNTFENARFRERAAFTDKTGLAYPIELTEVGQYAHLLDQISKHQAFLEKAEAQPTSFESAAEDWYRSIYQPLAGIIERGKLLEVFPGRTIEDLYTFITVRRWERGQTRNYGIGINKLVPDDMEAFREKMANLKENEYPEMQKGITAFVLMNVKASKEYRILENLYELKEVQEAHSVHGDVDLLVKVVLKRDLLSSDAEVIGQFVHEMVRKVPGVLSTQTLIPGLSKIKDVCDE